GERFLPHQLKTGCILETQERIPVTIGFQDNICPECRGEKPIHAPKASMPGYTSKVSRYYWREIALETTKRFHELNPGVDPDNFEHSEFSFPEQRKRIEKEVIAEIKESHLISPKYEYNEIAQSEIIKNTETEIILVKAKYVPTGKRKVGVEGRKGVVCVEEFASEYFAEKGYQSLVTESIPFHVIFGIYMWAIIQDPDDPLSRLSGFGSRTEFDESESKNNIIHTALPSDFGTAGYYQRRKDDIVQHIDELQDLVWLFDYWVPHSHDFRQYLWAHRDKDIETAKKIIHILSENDVKNILHYLIRNYWANFCGWPDLLVYKDKEIMFVEVKSSKDKLSEDQKNWLLGNKEHMGFIPKIFKISK
ncbi:MAG: hypothetical protein GY795_07135, partial [Desulfobacterales bacterium]|nr:hypothetical protein [Desulfobacterales bacterium]